MASALSRTQQLPREVTHSIFRRAFLTRYRLILLETLAISKAEVTVKLHRLREAGHSPVVPVIARQAIRAMDLVMRRTLTPNQLMSVNEICDLYLTVWPRLPIITHPD